MNEPPDTISDGYQRVSGIASVEGINAVVIILRKASNSIPDTQSSARKEQNI
jgi:hypothetical protein